MLIEDSFTLPVPPPRAAEALLDADTVSRCVPGVRDVEETEPDRYQATLGLQIGPVKPLFAGWVQVDRSETPKRLKATAEGRDRSTGSVAQVAFTADLEEEAERRTQVRVSADVRIRGRLGQFGTGVIQSAAKEVLRQFSSCLDTSLAAGGDEPASVPVSTGRSVGKVVWAVIRDFFRRLVGRGRAGR